MCPSPDQKTASPPAIECPQEELPPLAVKGIRLFNASHFFEAHEELELAWRAEMRPHRALYQGILQVGVAYYQLLRGNYPGAMKMFRRARRNMAGLPAGCMGVDLQTFHADFDRVEQAARALGPSRLARLDRSLIRALPMHTPLPEGTQLDG